MYQVQWELRQGVWVTLADYDLDKLDEARENYAALKADDHGGNYRLVKATFEIIDQGD